MSENLPKRSLQNFLSLRHPNHFPAGAKSLSWILPSHNTILHSWRSFGLSYTSVKVHFCSDCLLLYALVFVIITVKGGQAYPTRFFLWIDYLKNESVSCYPVVTVTSVKFSSAFCMRNERWICYENFSVFGQIENLSLDKISIRHLHQFRKTELVEIS